RFAEAIKARYPDKLLAYNCSPSFNWKKNLDQSTISRFQNELGAMGYKFQFITLAGFHALNYSMWELARDYRHRQLAAYTDMQQTQPRLTASQAARLAGAPAPRVLRHQLRCRFIVHLPMTGQHGLRSGNPEHPALGHHALANLHCSRTRVARAQNRQLRALQV